MLPRIIRICVPVLCLLLAACAGNDVKEMLGLNRKGPDAFQVYSRPPLTVPPEFSLQTPGRGAESVTGVSTNVQAHNEILGAGETTPAATVTTPGAALTGPAATAVPAVSASDLPSNADAQFLANAGALHADPHIRETIQQDKDAGILPADAPKDSSYLLNGKSSDDPTVDADKEASRLKADKAQGVPPTTGQTPVIVPQDKGILGDIF